MRTLLHCCCGPCASACAPALRRKGHDAALFYSNSNIAPAEEFSRRLDSLRILAEADGLECIVDPPDHADWLAKVAAGLEGEPEKGARCALCWRYSLERTARYAAANGFDAFATSLTVSPHKPSAAVFAAGRAASQAAGGIPFLEEDFKKKGGFAVSVERSRALGLYRQSWCGCEFSRRACAAAGRTLVKEAKEAPPAEARPREASRTQRTPA